MVDLGQIDRAPDYRREGFEGRIFGWYAPWMVTDPALAPLRASPRYPEVLEVVNLGG